VRSKPSPPAVDTLRSAFARFATGVAVVTARAADGTPIGITINSLASVSLDPPLLLWCLARSASSYADLCDARVFRVHVLAADQIELARRFALRGGDKFASGRWTLAPDAPPQLAGCVAWFECSQRSHYDEGDHRILVGRIEAAGAPGGAPLVFHDSRYLTALGAAAPPAPSLARP